MSLRLSYKFKLVIIVLFLILFLWSWWWCTKENLTQREVHIMGLDGCGLGNNLCQLATGIHYARKYKYRIVLNSASHGILWGTSNSFDRNRTRKSTPYTETIFSKLSRRDLTPIHDHAHVEQFHYSYDETTLIKPKKSTTILQLNGLCQNKNFYENIIPYLPLYLDLDNHEIQLYLWKKYNLQREQRNNIMISLRIGLDFAHMTRVNPATLRNALLIVANERSCRLVVISDTDDIGSEWKKVLEGFPYLILVEDDITQFYAGLCCNTIILGESTYHYWIALCRMALYKHSNVFLFKNTDLTNRNLALDHWVQLDLINQVE